MKYSLAPAEKIRQSLGIDFEELSFRIGYSHPAYRIAFERGYLTKRMAREIARRYKISFREFLDGGKWRA